ncbi:hypothetical protein C900_03732 [Fulvivirga imtechensis AK7]|uniref:Uncharacterized protein n=1 Tax=Fulvivirga imtechensis AK7 TaxID=1237149 RepID=L8JQI5_9BACT|nr:hypothetical protein C900_03732 [Fulvivirga imtechensis AK7]
MKCQKAQLGVREHFWDEHKADINVFLETLIMFTISYANGLPNGKNVYF